MFDPVLYEQDGHVVTLTLNRPEELNAFSDETMIEAFIAAVERIKAGCACRPCSMDWTVRPSPP